ncbi:helix-turn-helix domain-containing protein [Kitasatospora aureofaciens]|uniref:helix-turn-helix domain-containing protein n=1 Tax=Kitasatospora aureofaciens TaxID=1894 RepID=UPI000998B9E8|nr:helix-turn-helix transcriptional regulator [Kitasatospora aureofaciens]
MAVSVGRALQGSAGGGETGLLAGVIQDLVLALVDLRRSAGLSQRQVALLMSISQQAVSEFERAGGDPHLSTLIRYANAVGAHLTFRITLEQ